MTMTRLPTPLLLILVVGCTPTTTSPARNDGMVIQAPPPASTPVPASSSGQQRKADTPSMAGAWEGAACEGRAYVRLVSLESDGTFMATDRVAPCMRGAMCAWSGIILWKGTWRQQGNLVILDADRSTRLPDGVPEALRVEEGARVLVDTQAPSCRYLPSP
ncbi:MAG: hypothetical protein HY898_20845 [Deltaproteobacteria bacterium]|nr:hypothetical protein [Deltaproteobacteria bacterium]